jgi:hypothetical protein
MKYMLFISLENKLVICIIGSKSFLHQNWFIQVHYGVLSRKVGIYDSPRSLLHVCDFNVVIAQIVHPKLEISVEYEYSEQKYIINMEYTIIIILKWSKSFHKSTVNHELLMHLTIRSICQLPHWRIASNVQSTHIFWTGSAHNAVHVLRVIIENKHCKTRHRPCQGLIAAYPYQLVTLSQTEVPKEFPFLIV